MTQEHTLIHPLVLSTFGEAFTTMKNIEKSLDIIKKTEQTLTPFVELIDLKNFTGKDLSIVQRFVIGYSVEYTTREHDKQNHEYETKITITYNNNICLWVVFDQKKSPEKPSLKIPLEQFFSNIESLPGYLKGIIYDDIPIELVPWIKEVIENLNTVLNEDHKIHIQ